METTLCDKKELDVYKSSKGYVKYNVDRHSSRSGNYWIDTAQISDLSPVKTFALHGSNRLGISKIISIGYSAHEDIILRGLESSPFIEIKIKNKNFAISKALKDIAEEIKLSEELLDNTANWDYDGALPISQELYFSGINFLIKYSEFILKNLGAVIQSPEINAGRNGNIYLAWRTDNARLAISIEKNKTSEIIANYYGDLGNDREPIKGNVTVSKISEYLAYWMKYLA